MSLNALTTAIDAFARNDKVAARRQLSAYVDEHPGDEKGWFWMSRIAEQPDEKHQYLRRMYELRATDA